MKYFTLLLCLAGLASCYSEPEFPVEPEIEFKSVVFVDPPERPNANGEIPGDTLKITVSYRDGDGDLGIVEPSPDPFITLFNNRYIRPGDSDTLPEMNCTNYTTGFFDDKGVFQPDPEGTQIIYVQPNPLYYNFLIDLYTVRDGVETKFDFVNLEGFGCGLAPHGRFTLPTANRARPISGSITYNFSSSLLNAYFFGEELKLRVRITDRAGHISNIAESPVFTLQEIQK